MDRTSRTGGRLVRNKQAHTLAVFATGIIAEAMYVVGLGALCSLAIMVVLLAGG